MIPIASFHNYHELLGRDKGETHIDLQQARIDGCAHTVCALYPGMKLSSFCLLLFYEFSKINMCYLISFKVI